ncbi:hypothetical protein MKX01_034594, partial [Papaver californicum]
SYRQALLELCSLKNVVVVYRSFCIVRVILQHMWSLDSRSVSSVLCSGVMSRSKAFALRTKF